LPIIRLEEIREMTSIQRLQKLEELKTELSKIITMIKAGGSVENPGRTKVLRKTIARIETIINEVASK